MIRKIMMFVLALASITSISAQQYYVRVYDQCNFGGKGYTLEAGSYRLYQMKIDNDRLSSMEIPNGMKVTIYENDKFEGKSKTYTASDRCLEPSWRNVASSIVVENTSIPSGYSQNDYVTFYNDCYNRGYSQSLRPGSYNGAALGNLKLNISSLTISGNLQVKAYINSESLSGYSVIINSNQTCLANNVNDKIASLVIETRTTPVNNGGYGNNGNNGGYGNNGGGNGNTKYATFYQECNFNGNAIRLEPGYYQGDKLGILKNNISSIELPAGLRVKAYTNSDYLSGSSTTISYSENCLSGLLLNRIASLVVEETYGGGGNNGGWGGNNGNNNANNNYVVLYEDDDYRGRSATLLPGTYANMQLAGISDKSLSSLTVPPGWRVILYENENLGGKSFTITASRSGFSFTGWNDRTSSIAVYRN